jgi:hypothetical protein
MEHSFDIEVAQEYGIAEAIFIKHFQFWIAKNKANGSHQHNNRTWTYNSNKAFAELFPYLSTQSIRTALKHLTERGVIVTGNYNDNPYIKTLWYAFADENKWICQFQQTDLLKSTNGFVKNDKCINTDIDYTDNKPNKKTTNNISPSIPQGDVIEWSEEEEIFETFRLAYQGSKNGHDTEFKNFKKHKDWKEVVRFLLPAYERQEAIREQQKRETGWRPQPKNLKTWLSNRCWEEEIKYDSNQTTTNNHANEIERARQSALEHLRSKGINI